MTTFLYILLVLLILKLVFLNAIRLSQTSSGKHRELQKENLTIYALSLQRALSAMILVLIVILSQVIFGVWLGMLVSIVVAVEYSTLSRLSLVRKYSQQLFNKFEDKFLEILTKVRPYMGFIRSINLSDVFEAKQVNSRQELKEMIGHLSILGVDEKALMINSLDFNDRVISAVMVPRSVMATINKNEFLGPLILDELHKKGHSRLPVVDGDINHVVGVLHIEDLLNLDNKKSSTAEKIMNSRVYYIHQDQTLEHALAAFIKTGEHMFIVVNEYRETVGLLTLKDVIEVLIGRKLIDKFDAHNDLRAVALRLSKDNNNPPDSVDV